MIVLENPLLFASWLRSERQVIGDDVDIDALWAQYQDAKGCDHDPQALTDANVLRCECGTLGLTDSDDDDIPNCERWTVRWLPVTADGRPPRYRVRRGDVEQSVPVGSGIHNASDAVEHVTGGRVIHVDPAAESDADELAGWHPQWAVIVQLPA